MDAKTLSAYENMAKLSLTEDVRQWVIDSFNTLEESFKKLDGIDTEGVEPLFTVLDLKNVLREDASAKFIERDELLSNAPEEYDGYFQVPKTLE
ncbi:MAG: Asp-tRNA(Asn)/Glu-tRNA(Gln) amidotransferase subunit GatC [Lachnospiraceae bacterium]|nr:Asp-tRNA(Asn)/Glu-tRNA(Gln) amidotransferase subunit GatC [Lachnospiraceae bacterium]